METIHLKTIDPISQDLLRSAGSRGLKLTWDRYERLQPQDGFLRVGLSCPYGCLQGPCRIDPFGRGPDRGLCGLDRDGMVAALLLRLTLQGALEALNELPAQEKISEILWPPTLDRVFSQTIKKLGGWQLPIKEISHTTFLLHRPQDSPEIMILQSLRLGILALGFLEKRKRLENLPAGLSIQAGYGLLAGKEVIIGVCGQPSRHLIESLSEEIFRKLNRRGQIVSLGNWIPLKNEILPCACTSGETELLLSSGKIHLLIAGPGTDPSIVELCRILNIPLITSQDIKKPEEILRLAQEHSGISSQTTFNPDSSLLEEAEVIMAAQVLEELWKKESLPKVALIGGADTPQQSLGWIPVELASSLRGEEYLVASWGDAALWIIKKGLASLKYSPPVRILDEKKGHLLALEALAAAERLKDLYGICFTGLKSCKDLAMALGLAGLGLKVCAAIPLPLWGSEMVRNLLQEKLAALGGSLTHFDHPAHPQEILEWFLKEEL